MAKSILTVYNTVKEQTANVSKILEADPKADIGSALQEIKETMQDIMIFVRQHLICAHDIFYGSVLCEVDTDVDFKVRSLFDLKVDIINGFKLVVNPFFLNDYNFNEFETLLISELMRLVFNHPAAYSELNPMNQKNKHMSLEDASSVSIDTLIEKDIHLDKTNPSACLKIPNDFTTLPQIENELGIKLNSRDSINYYFKAIEKYRKNNSNNGNGSGAGSSDSSDNKSSESSRSGESPNSDVATPNNKNGESSHNWESTDSEKATEMTKQFISNVMNSMSAQDRGNIPGQISSFIQKLLQPPEINWKQYLAKMIGTIPCFHRPTNLRLNRRQPYRFDLSGNLPGKKVKIAIAIDTSGSMSDKVLSYCLNEIFEMVKGYPTEVTIIECDYEIGKVYRINDCKKIDYKLSGRGGTQFTPVINYVNKDPYFRDALLIYFTDGYGEYNIPKPKTYKNLWVVMGDVRNLSVKNPYGEIKSILSDKKAAELM